MSKGPPSKFSPIKRAAYVELLRKGGRRVASANAVGVDYNTVCAFNREHPEFKDDVDRAEIEACDQVEDALFKKAIDGNVTAMIFWLQNRSKERWKDLRAPSVVLESLSPKEPTNDEIVKELTSLLEAARKKKVK